MLDLKIEGKKWHQMNKIYKHCRNLLKTQNQPKYSPIIFAQDSSTLEMSLIKFDIIFLLHFQTEVSNFIKFLNFWILRNL